MIHEIGVELDSHLQSIGCPIPVIDGPERRITTTGARERVVIEHDPNGDSFESRHLADRVPRTRMTRLMGVKLTLYAQAGARSAIYWEHVRRVEHLLDCVLIGLDAIVKARKNRIQFRGGKLVEPQDLTGSETPGSATYELLVSIDRGVAFRKWNFGNVETTVVISPQMVGAPALTFDGGAFTIARSSGSWLEDGFAAQQFLLVAGTQHNNGPLGPIISINDTTMTFTGGVTAEGPVSGAAVTGNGVLISNAAQASGFTADGGTQTEMV